MGLAISAGIVFHPEPGWEAAEKLLIHMEKSPVKKASPTTSGDMLWADGGFGAKRQGIRSGPARNMAGIFPFYSRLPMPFLLLEKIA